MGSYISSLCHCSSIIDEKIGKMIFHPPQIDVNIYSQILVSSRSALIELTTLNNEKISVVQVKPTFNEFPQKYIVFSHGNSSDILTMFEYFKDLADELNIGVIGYDYIGYGLSEKTIPTEQGCYDSIETVIDSLIDNWQIEPKNIYLVGHSLGTGITIDYVSKHVWNTPVILISPYKSICKVVADTFCVAPFDKFQSQHKLQHITCPIKIFHGCDDQIINISHGVYMYNNLRNKLFDPVWFSGTDHDNILQRITMEHYLDVINYQK